MVQVDLKHLLNRLNAYVKRALETAAGLCISRGNYEVTIEHVFLVMIDDVQRDLGLILRHFESTRTALKTELLRQVEAMKVGNSGRPVFAPTLIEFFTDSWLVSSVDMGAGPSAFRIPGHHGDRQWRPLRIAGLVGPAAQDSVDRLERQIRRNCR